MEEELGARPGLPPPPPLAAGWQPAVGAYPLPPPAPMDEDPEESKEAELEEKGEL